MHGLHSKCDKPKRRPPRPITPLDPDSCFCQPQLLEETSEVEIDKDAEIKHWSTLTPKASVEIVEKPEVEDIEIAIFLERIISLFGRVMKKLELAATLPILLEDPELPQILTATELMTVKAALRYHETLTTASQSVATFVDTRMSFKSYDESIESSDSACVSEVLHPTIYEALTILNSYSAIRKKVKASARDIAPQCHLFLQHMKYFIEHCVLRIRSTPIQAKRREIHFRKLWRENREAQKQIAEQIKFLEMQRSSHYDLMKDITAHYRGDADTVHRINKKCAEDIKATINRLERKQILEHKSSEMRHHDLGEYLAMANNKLDNIREANLQLEQDIRNKRFKVSSQLWGQISKFDIEVGARNDTLKELTAEFEADKRLKEELTEEMASQLEIYDAFVEERNQTNLKIFHEKLEKFVKTRAAKIIQRWWRPIFKRLKKKKKKKGKKGKKKK